MSAVRFCQGDNNILNHLLAMPQVLSNVKVPVACSIVVMTQAVGTCIARQGQEGVEGRNLNFPSNIKQVCPPCSSARDYIFMKNVLLFHALNLLL